MKEGYLPLYRKYRPQKLEDIVGQAHIKKALANAIELNKIAHAYLFTGPRGTGKTSTARILAKSLNCVNGPTVTPCEECESCQSITNTIPIDVIELDAASNRSVDDAREILEKVNYAPVHGKYKIYIIDEVHMLTKEAFNALLKTLEEPPQNVIFILATTEAHKVMDTIKSRCQRFDFKRITTGDIIEHLKNIAQKENINISDGAISLIAKSSSGGMRDSLSLLDQVSNIGAGKEITEDDINSLLGRLSFESLLELSTHIVNSDGAETISLLNKIYNDGNEPIQIMNNLMLFFKNMLVIKTCEKSLLADLTGLTEEQIKALEAVVANLEKHQIVFLINKSAEYIKELKDTTNQQMWLEVALIDLSNFAANTKLIELENRIARLEGGGPSPVPRVSKIIETPVVAPKPQAQNAPQIQSVSISENTKEIAESVDEELSKVEKKIKPEPKQQSQQVSVLDADLDLKQIWMNILQNIPANSVRERFNQVSNLVRCDEDGIEVAAKKVFVNSLNEASKKQMLTEAACAVLGKSSLNVLIREQTASDADIQKVKIPQPKKTVLPPKELVFEDETSQEDAETVDKVEVKQESKHGENVDNTLSEQANMVVDLFDGKVIE